MNINLFRAIHLSRLRIEPAVKKQASKGMYRECYMRYLRVLSPLGEIPLFVTERYNWYLDGENHSQSKTGIAFRELIEAGLSRETIWHRRPHNPWQHFVIKVFRIGCRLPRMFILVVSKFSILKKLDLVALQVIVGYVGFKGLFNSHSHLIPIINSDISPTLHMQWAGALAAGNKVMWWQDDYHHYDGFPDEHFCSYKFDFAAVLNNHGLRTAKLKSRNASLFVRPSLTIKPMRSIPENPRVGFASNVYFEANEEDCERIEHLMRILEAELVLVRLHPNSKLHETQPENPLMYFAHREQSIEEFVESVDIIFVGVSAVQLKLLCTGVPVIHISGFDQFGFDLYRYCQMGLVYGKQNIDEIRLEDAQNFYKNPEHSKKLKEYVQVEHSIAQPLNNLKYYV